MVVVVAVIVSAAPEAAHFRAVLVEVRLARRRRPRAALGVRVHRLRHDHLEPVQRVTRRRLEDSVKHVRHATSAETVVEWETCYRQFAAH